MSNREQHGLRGNVKSCAEESIFPSTTDADGQTHPEVHSEHSTEYGPDGRILATRSLNSDGSYWGTRYDYDASGRLIKTASGSEGAALAETIYSYDPQGRLQNISDGNKPNNPVTFRYDERGRKSKIEISGAADYRSNVSFAGSPFEVADRAPNLPGGGIATTIYDERDRATEVQVTDANGELVSRALRTYDPQGRVIDEKQILDNPVAMFPLEIRTKILEQSGLSDGQLRQEIRGQFAKLMAFQSEAHSISYGYDAHGRVTHTSRRIFNHEEEIDTIYNEHGDPESEITRSTRSAAETDSTSPALPLPSYSEVRYSYQYDQHENWTEKAVSYRSSPEGPFQSPSVTKRTLAYY